MPLVNVNGKSFDLITSALRYSFHVSDNGDLIQDHFGALVIPDLVPEREPNGWGGKESERRKEFPGHGRGDFRRPAFHIRHADGRTVTHLKYTGHRIVIGKPELEGLPFCAGHMAETLIVTLTDDIAKVRVEITYCPYDRHDCVTKSWKMFNDGDQPVTLERVGSSLDMEVKEEGWEMMYLVGDWARECQLVRRKVEIGTQGFESSTGMSSHYANPFVTLVEPNTTETSGTAYGMSYVYSGSHSTTVEQTSVGHTRVTMGLHDLHTSIPLLPGKSFQAPEIVYVYSPDGLGRMSRAFHCFYREHLASERSWTLKDRPVLINNWEATYFDFTQDKLLSIARSASELEVKLFVLDDGWFGKRVSDKAGLGDWTPNPDRFPKGLEALVKRVNDLKTRSGDGMKFGIWVEPEMVNPDSELYAAHPDWVQHALTYDRTEQRNQLILNLALPEVQDYIIDSMTNVLKSANIQYVKWDHNRGIHELPSPGTAHAHIVGLYRVLDTLVNRFPDVLWEGCASGGGRFDPGMLYYFCQSWTSDNTDALERLSIQFGTSLVYPPSSMGCHVSVCPNHQMNRTTPLEFRAHVAMMGGSFGFELDLAQLSEEERKMIPGIISLAERVNPFVIRGNMYRLADLSSNWPAVMFVLDDQAVILAYQIKSTVQRAIPRLRLQGLDGAKKYSLEGVKGYESVPGGDLMGLGVALNWRDGWASVGDYGSKVIFVQAQ